MTCGLLKIVNLSADLRRRRRRHDTMVAHTLTKNIQEKGYKANLVKNFVVHGDQPAQVKLIVNGAQDRQDADALEILSVGTFQNRRPRKRTRPSFMGSSMWPSWVVRLH